MKDKTSAANQNTTKISEVYEGLLSAEEVDLIAHKIREEKKLLVQKKKAKLKEIKDTIVFLCERFPNCFSLYRPVPLKVGIFNDMKTALLEEGNFEKPALYRQAMKCYTHSYRYYSSILVQTHRVDLEGGQAEEIPPDHKNFARMLIKQRFEYKLKQRKALKKKASSSDQVVIKETLSEHKEATNNDSANDNNNKSP